MQKSSQHKELVHCICNLVKEDNITVTMKECMRGRFSIGCCSPFSNP
jgi:hypothetical protein